MRYLAFHEDTCIISDVESDMRIINGTVLGMPVHSIIHNIFAKQYDVRNHDTESYDKSLSIIVDRVLADALDAVIHNPYACKIHGAEFTTNCIIYHGYVEYVFIVGKHDPSQMSSCMRCGAHGSFGQDVYECIMCQRKPLITKMSKCKKCGCLGFELTVCNDVCMDCVTSYCDYCKKSIKGSFISLSDSWLDEYCNSCLPYIGCVCFICGKREDKCTERVLCALHYDNNELYVMYNGDESDILVCCYNKKHINNIIHKYYNNTLLSKFISTGEGVACHMTCANVAYNLNIIIKPVEYAVTNVWEDTNDYTSEYAVTNANDYTSDYANDYANDYTSDYTNDYTSDYTGDYAGDYTNDTL